MLGEKPVAMVGVGNEAVADIIDAGNRVPGLAVGKDSSGDGAQRERPAVADIACRAGDVLPLVDIATGIAEGQLRREAIGAGASCRG